MVKSIETSLEKFRPLEEISHKILLLVTHKTNYMKSTGEKLKEPFPKLIHLTSLAHGLHNISETIGLTYPLIDKFKKMLTKSPNRIETFKRLAPNLPLPPKLVITRWGTLDISCYLFCKKL